MSNQNFKEFKAFIMWMFLAMLSIIGVQATFTYINTTRTAHIEEIQKDIEKINKTLDSQKRYSIESDKILMDIILSMHLGEKDSLKELIANLEQEQRYYKYNQTPRGIKVKRK